MKRVYIKEGVNAGAVKDFILNCGTILTAPRALQILKGGETVVKCAFAPYEPDGRMYLYSLSKPFCSVMCGICIDEGLLSPDVKLCELFPDKMPGELTEGLKKLTLEDCLTMRCGHGRCVLEEMRWSKDALKEFFAFPMQFEPGETFVYSTGATMVCAAAVERVTGRKFADLAYEKLFSKLGVEKPEWREALDGTNLGGTGLMVNTETVARFGQMLLQKGVYNGKRIVSEEYIKNATSKHTESYVNHVSPDWSSGYGYQFWKNGRGGFRGDGAYGQIMFVLPEEDVVAVFFGESYDAVKEFEFFNKMLDDLFKPGDCPAEEVEKLCENLYSVPKTEPFRREADLAVAPNGAGITRVRLCAEGDGLCITVTADGRGRVIRCGNGEYIRSVASLRDFDITQVPSDPALGREIPFDVYGSYEYSGDTVTATFRHADTCHTQKWIFDLNAGKWTVEPRCGNLCIREFDISAE